MTDKPFIWSGSKRSPILSYVRANRLDTAAAFGTFTQDAYEARQIELVLKFRFDGLLSASRPPGAFVAGRSHEWRSA